MTQNNTRSLTTLKRPYSILWCSFIGIIMFCSSSFAKNTIAVEVYTPESSQNTNQTIQLTGTIEAEQHAQLGALESGVISDLFVEVGDSVLKGETLMSLDSTLAELTLSEIKAALSAAQVARDEAERLFQEVLVLSKKQVVAQTLIAERRAALAAAEAELVQRKASVELQQEIVKRHILIAPFSGVIATRNADLGEWVTQQTTVFTLIEQDTLRLSVAIPQEYYSMLTGREIDALVQPDFINSRQISAKLDRLVSVTDNQSRTLIGHIYLPSDINLLAGMSASAQIILPEQTSSFLWLPRTALKIHPDGGNSVFTVENNIAKRILVEVVGRQDDLIAVKNAPAGQAYVISGVELLRDGDALQIKNSTGLQ